MRYKLINIVILVLLIPVVLADTLEISGHIYRNGTVELENLIVSNNLQTNPETGGTHLYQISLLDTTGITISYQTISSSFGTFYHSNDAEHDKYVEEEIFSFLSRIPIRSDAHILIIRDMTINQPIYYVNLYDASCTGMCVGCDSFYEIDCTDNRQNNERKTHHNLMDIILIGLILLVASILIIMVIKNKQGGISRH
ncbi:MAG: hypothetical protein ACMXYL_03250 [Candidatus Woesearchaeota archaeon]